MIKITRNDKCPCGSGKKYKKCCLLDYEKEYEVQRAAFMAETYDEVVAILSKPTLVYQMKIDLIRMGSAWIEDEVSRVIAIKDNQSLYDFHRDIQELFDWDNDHMFSFFFGEELYDTDNEYSADPLGEHHYTGFGKPSKSAVDTELRDLNLPLNFSFWYLFDYGADLVHKVTVEKIREMVPEEDGFPKLINKTGDNRPQYPVFDYE